MYSFKSTSLYLKEEHEQAVRFLFYFYFIYLALGDGSFILIDNSTIPVEKQGDKKKSYCILLKLSITSFTHTFCLYLDRVCSQCFPISWSGTLYIAL